MSETLHQTKGQENLDELNLKKLNSFLQTQKRNSKHVYQDQMLNCVPKYFEKLFTPYGFHPKTTQEANTIFHYLYLTEKDKPFTISFNHYKQPQTVSINENTALFGWYEPFWDKMTFEQKLKVVLWTGKILQKQLNAPLKEISFVSSDHYLRHTGGSFGVSSQTIFINPNCIIKGNFYYRLFTIIHEMYHAKYGNIVNNIPNQSKLNKIESYYLGLNSVNFNALEAKVKIEPSEILKMYRNICYDETGAFNKAMKLAQQIHSANSKMFGKNLKDDLYFKGALNWQDFLVRYAGEKTNNLSDQMNKVVLYDFITENQEKTKAAEVLCRKFNQGVLAKDQIEKDFFKDLPVKDNCME